MTDTEKLQLLKLAVDQLLRQPAIDGLFASDMKLWLLALFFPGIAKPLTELGKSLTELMQLMAKISYCNRHQEVTSTRIEDNFAQYQTKP